MTQPPEGGPQQGPRYGTDPYDPSAMGGPMPEPPKFARLKQLTLISLALYVVSLVLGLIPAFTGGMRDQLVEQYRGMGMSDQEIRTVVDGAVTASIATSVVIAIIGIGLYLLVYFGLAKRKNWARIVGVIFAILGALGMLFSAGSGLLMPTAVTIVAALVSLAGAVVAIIWLITAFNGQVKQYLTQG